MPYSYNTIMQGVKHAGLGLALALCLPWSGVATAQPAFNSGSNGSDGALSLTTPGTRLFFDPASFGQLDPDGDGVYHFTTITIASGVTVDMTAAARGPVVWLATGLVQINGIIDLNGHSGHPGGTTQSNASTAQPAAGGFAGGNGVQILFPAQAGGGPGGGQVHSVAFGGGGGAGHLGPGGNGLANGVPAGSGRVYGNAFLLPLIGGSGGAGGGVNSSFYGAGGGAGGGAILIASSDRILVNGTIRANGGNSIIQVNGASPGGGGGSGGSIRLIAPIVSGAGTLAVNGGSVSGVSFPGGAGSPGRLRVEAFQVALTGSTGPIVLSTPGVVFLPSSRQPVRIVRVGDVLVPETPTGSLTNADVVLDASTPTTLDIAAHGVPPGTVVRVTVLFNSTDALTFNSTPLSGTLASSTATAVVTIPHGFSQFLVEANWTP